MISLSEKVNGEVETNTANVDRAVNTANTASSRANQTLETAQEAINEAETTLQAANTAKTGAQSSAAAAEQIAEGLGGFDGSAASVTAVDTQGLAVGGGKNTNAQALFNALALKVAQELVSNTKLAQQLADYVKKTDIVQTETTATNKVPSSAYLKQVKADINSNLASIGTGTQLATLSMNNKSITGISFNDYKTVEIMVIIQQASNGNMFFNFTLVPLVSHILDGTRYITIPGKSYGYCANVLLSINYSAGTVTLIEADANEGFGLNAIYILGLK